MQAQYVSNDPGYIVCQKKECKKYDKKGRCLVKTCSASIIFHVINIRTDIQFVFFGAGFQTPCVLAKSDLLKFANPKKPLYGHLSSVDSTGTSVSTIFFMYCYNIWTFFLRDACMWLNSWNLKIYGNLTRSKTMIYITSFD